MCIIALVLDSHEEVSRCVCQAPFVQYISGAMALLMSIQPFVAKEELSVFPCRNTISIIDHCQPFPSMKSLMTIFTVFED